MRAIDVQSLSNAEVMNLGRRILAKVPADAEFAALLSDYGITSDTFEDGQALLDAFEGLSTSFQDWKGRTQSAITARDTYIDAMRKEGFDDHVGRARLALGESSGEAVRLGLPGLTHSSLSVPELIKRGRTFYTLLNEDADLRAGVAEKGLTHEMIADGVDAVNEAQRLDHAYDEALTTRQKMRADRDDARKPLVAWIREVQRTAKLALGEDDRLELVGFVVDS